MIFKALLTCLGVVVFFNPLLFDFNTCTRRCGLHFSSEDPHIVEGKRGSRLGCEMNIQHWDSKLTCCAGVWVNRFARWIKKGEDYCQCVKRVAPRKYIQLGHLPQREFEEEALGYPYIWEDSRVVGYDQQVYDSKAQARRNNQKVLHCGPHVGACSNEGDIRGLHKISGNMTSVVAPCMISYLFLGRYANQLCMKSRFQDFTPECSQCWTEDAACLLSHCYYSCILKTSQWLSLVGLVEPKADNSEDQDACLMCMEGKRERLMYTCVLEGYVNVSHMFILT